MTQAAKATRRKVVIIGGGFAGIHAAIGLKDEPVDITLVDRSNHHTFQPLLYQVALAVLSPADIAQPIRSILAAQPNARVLMDEAVGFDIAARRVELGSGNFLEYDWLIVATGVTHSYFGHDDWAELAPGLKSIEDAVEIRRRVLLAFELAEREALETGKHPELNFVVIGGGPTGVELAGAISDTARLYMRNNFHYIDPAHARVMLLEGLPRILSAYPEDLSESAKRQLERIGVEVHLNTLVTGMEPGCVYIGKQRIPAAVTLWAAGVKASPLGSVLGFPMDKNGCVIVGPQMNPPGHPEIFVCGDLAHIEIKGRLIPPVAQPAMQMGNHAARLIRDDLAGKPRTDFSYFDKGDMATIGRKAAVARIVWPFRANWSGAPAWLVWLTVHIFFLIGFRNRVIVFLEWLWTYSRFKGGARLITGPQDLPGWNKK